MKFSPEFRRMLIRLRSSIDIALVADDENFAERVHSYVMNISVVHHAIFDSIDTRSLYCNKEHNKEHAK